MKILYDGILLLYLLLISIPIHGPIVNINYNCLLQNYYSIFHQERNTINDSNF